MITVKIFTSKDTYSGFHVSGHSGYDDPGKDIVCASVSSAVQLTANGITVCAKAKADIKVDDGDISVLLLDKNEKTQLLIDSFVLHIKELSKDFKDYLNIEILEV